MTRSQKITPIMCNTIQEDDVRLALNLLEQDEKWFDPGGVASSEKWFAAWLGVKKTFGFMGGRASLYAIVKALKIGKGDEIILPGLTCQVVVNAFEYNEVTCVFADIERDTFNLDAKRFAEKITPKTKAVLFQHTFGIPARDTHDIIALAREHGLIVIEDTAHGLGGTLDGQKLGTFGDVSFFSSERTKIINTIHGGFVASSDQEILKNIEKIYHNSALPDKNTVRSILHTLLYCYYTKVHTNRDNLIKFAKEKYGHNLIHQMTEPEFKGEFEPMYSYRMPGAIGELALNQLAKFESFLPERQRAADVWRKWALEQGYQVPQPTANSVCAWIRYPVIVPEDKKQDTSWIADELDMEAGVWFQTPCHPAVRDIPDIPVGWEISRKIINLPTGLWVK